MAKSLAKVQKKISKKGKTNTLHENSRDSQRLRRASARSDKLHKLSAARAKTNQTLLTRIAFFQGVAKAAVGILATEEIQALVQRFLNRYDDELIKAKNDRRPGRPSSTREDLLKQCMLTEDREYSAGFWIPDLHDQQTLDLLQSWNGEWTSLSNLKYIRLTRNGLMRQSSFPPKGQS